MPKLSRILIIISVVILVIVFFVFWLLTKNKSQIPIVITTPTQQQQSLSFSINVNQTNVNINNKIKVSIYLNGPSAKDVNAFDIKINYDRTKLNLINATHGAFFNKYLEVKWNLLQAWFSLARNPSQNASFTASPLLTLEFLAISKADKTAISIDPSSSIYISNTGSVSPIGSDITLTIN